MQSRLAYQPAVDMFPLFFFLSFPRLVLNKQAGQKEEEEEK
jgi:hypothetical protein